MLDPQATLQAWRGAVDEDGYDEIRIEGIISAGDALAVLVPQLSTEVERLQGSLAAVLDQLAERNREYHAADDANDTLVALLQEVGELLTETDAALGLEETYPLAELPERVWALGERCHQLEGALREIEKMAERVEGAAPEHRWIANYYVLPIVRAALGEEKS